MNKLTSLAMKIEKEREYMMTLANKYGYMSEVVLKTSQELDKLIHEYQKELKDKRA